MSCNGHAQEGPQHLRQSGPLALGEPLLLPYVFPGFGPDVGRMNALLRTMQARG